MLLNARQSEKVSHFGALQVFHLQGLFFFNYTLKNMQNLLKQAFNWALSQMAGPFAAELLQKYGFSAGDFVQLVRSDPQAALQQLTPIIEKVKAEHPEEFGRFEAMYQQYAPLFGQQPGKK